MAISERIYELSFTTGGLFTTEAHLAALLYEELRDWDLVRHKIKSENLLQARTLSSGTRVSREVVARLSNLSKTEIEVIATGAPQDQAHLMWIAASRRYRLIAEFAEEVVRERFLLLTPTLKYEDFDSFFRAKALWADQLNELSGSTTKKLRQNLFKMLRDAGLLSADGYILHTMLSPTVSGLLTEHCPAEFHLFPLSDSDISRAVR